MLSGSRNKRKEPALQRGFPEGRYHDEAICSSRDRVPSMNARGFLPPKSGGGIEMNESKGKNYFTKLLLLLVPGSLYISDDIRSWKTARAALLTSAMAVMPNQILKRIRGGSVTALRRAWEVMYVIPIFIGSVLVPCAASRASGHSRHPTQRGRTTKALPESVWCQDRVQP